MTRLRQARPVAPQERVHQLGLRGRRAGENRIGAGVERLRDALDVATLACSIAALVHDDERNALLVHERLQLVQTLLLLFQLLLVLSVIAQMQVRANLLDAWIVLQNLEFLRALRGRLVLTGSLCFVLRLDLRLLLGRAFALVHPFLLLALAGGIRSSLLGGFLRGFVLALRQGVLIGAHELAQDGQVHATAILSVQHDPRSVIEIRLVQHLVVDLVHAVVIVQLRQVALIDAPGRIRIRGQRAQTVLHGVLRDVQEELLHQVAVIHKLAFEGIDGMVEHIRLHLVRLFGGVFVQKRLHLRERRIVQQRLTQRGVPAAIEERDIATRTQRFPEVLQQRVVPGNPAVDAVELLRLFGVQVLRYIDGRRTGVQMVQDVGDAATLPGSVPAFEQHHHAHAFLFGALLQHDKLVDQLIPLFLVLLLVQLLLVEINLIQHGATSLPGYLTGTLPHRCNPLACGHIRCIRIAKEALPLPCTSIAFSYGSNVRIE